MAFKADCGSSTVLEALFVASTARSLVPGEFSVVLRDSSTPTGGFGRRLEVWGRQIRNPKSEIRNSYRRCKLPPYPLVCPLPAATLLSVP